jgi:hypothetical protein
MPFLDSFSFEVFLSYGWAESKDPRQGGRGWAAQLRQWLIDEIGKNLVEPRIFLDDNAERVGPISSVLLPAVERSAVFVLAVSPGSCRPTSWCQKEITHFWDTALPLASRSDLVAPEDRIFKVIQSVPNDDTSVEPLKPWDLPRFNLFNETMGAGGLITTSAIDLAPPVPDAASRELRKLASSIRTTLERIKALQQDKPPAGKIFLGSTFSEANDQRFRSLRRELLQNGYEVHSVTPLPPAAEIESGHRVRVETALDQARLAVHIMPETLRVNPGWERNHAAQQVRYSLVKSKSSNFCVYLWEDPDQKDIDAQCREQRDEFAAVSGIQNVQGTLFGELKADIKRRLAQPVRRFPERDPNIRYDVVIDHTIFDTDAAAKIRKHIEDRHNLFAQLAVPKQPNDNDLQRHKRNKEWFYSRAERFLVLYGRTDDEWAHDVCFTVEDFIRPNHQGCPGLVVLAPPPDQPDSKHNYRAPVPDKFATRNCPDGNFAEALDDWLGGRCR